MIFVDTNVFMYAIGRRHPLVEPARSFFATCLRREVDGIETFDRTLAAAFG